MPRQFSESPYSDDPSHLAGPGRESPRRSNQDNRPQSPRPRRSTAAEEPRDSRPAAAPRKRSSRRGRGRGGSRPIELTSLPTSRNAYVDTRSWLLAQHGPVCAYCGQKFAERTMTLDHVAPRRGQTAYDRRDNLVLACTGCNALKRDLPPMAFLLQSRARAINLLRYGSHLSTGLVELAKSLVPEELRPHRTDEVESLGWALLDDVDGESPYRD